MAEKKPDDSASQEQTPYTPASPILRIIAWVGVVYMVALVLLNIYPFFSGTNLTGIAPLMVCPGVAGLAAIAFYQLGKLPSKGGKAAMILLAAACIVVFLLGLKDGIPPLIAGLGGNP